MSITHTFRSSLASSAKWKIHPMWDEIYGYFFGGKVLSRTANPDHNTAQLWGIDSTVVLDSGKTFWIDEKVRSPDKNYGDICLEITGDIEENRPGWIQKDLGCDFIIYTITARKWAFLLPVVPLQLAWKLRGEEWQRAADEQQGLVPEVRQFSWVRAENETHEGKIYHSLSVAVPPRILYETMNKACFMEFKCQP